MFYTSKLKSPKPNNPLIGEKMKAIKRENTKPEIIVRKFLFSKGLRYYTNYKKLPGKPDIVFSKDKIAIFINGCFWHAHSNCRFNKLPKSHREYWVPKINNNIYRDKRNHQLLNNLGWRVLIIWECEVKEINTLNSLFKRILELKKNRNIIL